LLCALCAFAVKIRFGQDRHLRVNCFLNSYAMR
jgi:hypothetical protein